MADELKPSPRNELLFSIAQKLRKAPATLGRANPILGRLAESGKEYLTEPIARGLENWAYGDRMFGPPANAPLVNSRTGDMLSAVPVGALSKAPGAAMAQLVPAVPLLNQDATAAARLAKRIAGADDAVKQGATLKEIWSNFGLSPAPGLAHPTQTGLVSRRGSALRHSRWLEEIDPENILKSGAEDVQTSKTLKDVLDSPNLLRQYPFLGDIEFHVPGIKQDKVAGWFKPWEGPEGRIEMFEDAFKTRSPDPFGDVAAHEISHGVMSGMGQVNAFGHSAPEVSPAGLSKIADIRGFLQTDPFAEEKYGWVPEQLGEMLRAPQGRIRSGTGWWDRSAGETLAELVSKRRADLHMGGNVKNVPPTDYYDPLTVLNDQVVDNAASIGQHAADTGAPLPYAVDSFLRLLRDRGVIPK